MVWVNLILSWLFSAICFISQYYFSDVMIIYLTIACLLKERETSSNLCTMTFVNNDSIIRCHVNYYRKASVSGISNQRGCQTNQYCLQSTFLRNISWITKTSLFCFPPKKWLAKQKYFCKSQSDFRDWWLERLFKPFIPSLYA